MFGMESKKVIIVVDSKTDAYGELLSAMLSSNDEDNVESVIWTEKAYRDNKPQLSSNNKVIYIGQNKTSDPIIANIVFRNEFSKYGIYYGGLGNKAVIYCDENVVLSEEELYKSFIEDFSKYMSLTDPNEVGYVEVKQLETKFEEDKKENIREFVNKGIEVVNIGLKKPSKKIFGAENSIELPHMSKNTINQIANLKEKVMEKIPENYKFTSMDSNNGIRDQQYRCAVLQFYKEFVEAFI